MIDRFLASARDRRADGKPANAVRFDISDAGEPHAPFRFRAVGIGQLVECQTELVVAMAVDIVSGRLAGC